MVTGSTACCMKKSKNYRLVPLASAINGEFIAGAQNTANSVIAARKLSLAQQTFLDRC